MTPEDWRKYHECDSGCVGDCPEERERLADASERIGKMREVLERVKKGCEHPNNRGAKTQRQMVEMLEAIRADQMEALALLTVEVECGECFGYGEVTGVEYNGDTPEQVPVRCAHCKDGKVSVPLEKRL